MRPSTTSVCNTVCGGDGGDSTFFTGIECTTFLCGDIQNLLQPNSRRRDSLCFVLATAIGGECTPVFISTNQYRSPCNNKRVWLDPGLTARGNGGDGTCGHGFFNFTTGNCQCDNGWSWQDADLQPLCTVYNCYTAPTLNDPSLICSGHGICSTGPACQCDVGWTGGDCSTPVGNSCNSTTICNNRGYCDILTGACVCDIGKRAFQLLSLFRALTHTHTCTGPHWNYTGLQCQTLQINSSFTCQGAWREGDPGHGPYCECPGNAALAGKHCEVNTCPFALTTGTRCGHGSCVITNMTGLFPWFRASILRPTCVCTPDVASIARRFDRYLGNACEYDVYSPGQCYDTITSKVCGTDLVTKPGSCSFVYPNTTITTKIGQCSCSTPWIPPFCEYTQCDDPTLGLPNCNANRGGQCSLFNATTGAYNCSCPSVVSGTGARLFYGPHCETDVTDTCGCVQLLGGREKLTRAGCVQILETRKPNDHQSMCWEWQLYSRQHQCSIPLQLFVGILRCHMRESTMPRKLHLGLVYSSTHWREFLVRVCVCVFFAC